MPGLSRLFAERDSLLLLSERERRKGTDSISSPQSPLTSRKGQTPSPPPSTPLPSPAERDSLDLLSSHLPPKGTVSISSRSPPRGGSDTSIARSTSPRRAPRPLARPRLNYGAADPTRRFICLRRSVRLSPLCPNASSPMTQRGAVRTTKTTNEKPAANTLSTPKRASPTTVKN